MTGMEGAVHVRVGHGAVELFLLRIGGTGCGLFEDLTLLPLLLEAFLVGDEGVALLGLFSHWLYYQHTGLPVSHHSCRDYKWQNWRLTFSILGVTFSNLGARSMTALAESIVAILTIWTRSDV